MDYFYCCFCHLHRPCTALFGDFLLVPEWFIEESGKEPKFCICWKIMQLERRNKNSHFPILISHMNWLIGKIFCFFFPFAHVLSPSLSLSLFFSPKAPDTSFYCRFVLYFTSVRQVSRLEAGAWECVNVPSYYYFECIDMFSVTGHYNTIISHFRVFFSAIYALLEDYYKGDHAKMNIFIGRHMYSSLWRWKDLLGG